MAKVTILYWQDIPSVVEARDSNGKHKVELSQRFQELIDLVAMRKKMAGTDEYLMQWSKGKAEEQPGSAVEACEAAAKAIESRYEEIRSEELAKCSGD